VLLGAVNSFVCCVLGLALQLRAVAGAAATMGMCEVVLC
jgi:hypothetical protein